MEGFKGFHPFVNFLYFATVIVFSMCSMHPVFLVISILCSFLYLLILKKRDALWFVLKLALPMMLFAAIINPLFSHEGADIIAYLPGGSPITVESVLYGIASAVMIASVICWFSCYNEIMTSDKFIYLFGKILPHLSLVLSMTLRFVPRFKARIRALSVAQMGIGKDFSEKSIFKRAKLGTVQLSAMATWALENSIETADSMKCRGYGLSGRSTFSIFSFKIRDAVALIIMIILIIYIAVGFSTGSLFFSFYPVVKAIDWSLYNISVFATYFLFCCIPVIVEVMEVVKWKRLVSKI